MNQLTTAGFSRVLWGVLLATALSPAAAHAVVGTLADSSGECVAWGDNFYGQTNVPVGSFTTIAAGHFHSLGIRSDGTLAGWGTNGNGQTTVPAGVFTAIAGGNSHSLGIRSNGTLAGWGYNFYGQTTVPGGTFTAVAAGDIHSLGIRGDGTLAGWGYNGDGQTNVPVGSFTAIAAGGAHGLGIRSDGTLAGWGFNGSGQANVPVGSFTAIAAGSDHSLGIRSDGTLAGWGFNFYGQTTVPSGSFTAIAAGSYHSLGIRSDGTLAGWGSNISGETDVPAGIFTAVAAGGNHGLALRARTDYDGDLLVDGLALGVKAQLNRSVTVAGDAVLQTPMTFWNDPLMEVGGKLRLQSGAGIDTSNSAGAISAGGLEVATAVSLDSGLTLTTTGPWSGGADLTLNGARVTAYLVPGGGYTGNLAVNSNALHLSGTGDLTANSLAVAGGGQVRVGAGSRLAVGAGASSNAGLIQVIGNSSTPAELEFAGTMTNAASTGIIDTRNAIVHFDGTLSNQGSFSVGPGATDTFGKITNAATGRIAVTGGAGAIFHDDMTQNGSLTVSKVGSTTSVAVFLGGFTGSGGFTGGGDVFFEGDLRPGNSPASVLMDGNVFFGPGSNTIMELAGLTQGTDYDHLTVTGTLTLGGVLDVVLLNSFSPTAGNTFDLFDGTLTGTFANINLPSLDPGLSWDTSALYTTGTLSVTPEPATLALLAISGLLLARRRAGD